MDSYKGIFKAAFGEKSGWFCSLIVGLFATCILVLYTLILGLFSEELFKMAHMIDWCKGSGKCEQGFCIGMITVLVGVPLSFLRKLKYFKVTSLIGLLSLAYVICVHAAFAFGGYNLPLQKGYTWNMVPSEPINLIKFIALMGAAFNCHFNAANYYHDLGCNINKFKKVCIYSFSIMFIANALAGYFVIANFNAHVGLGAPCIYLFRIVEGISSAWKIAGAVGCFLVALNIAFGYGMVLFAVRVSVNEIYQDIKSKKDDTFKEKSGHEMSYCQHILMTFGIVIFVSLMSIILILCSSDMNSAMNSIALVLDIATGVFSCNVGFTLPGVMYLRIKKDKTKLDWAIIISLISLGALACFTGVWSVALKIKEF